MKKITLAAALGVSLLAQSALGAGLGADAVFSAESEKLTVNGTGTYGSEVTMVVLPFDTDIEALTPELASDGEAVFNMAHTDKEGKFNFTMGFPDSWEGGMYKAVIYQGTESAEIWFSYTNADNAGLHLDALNDGSASVIADILSENSSDLGAEPELAEKYADILGAYLYANKPADGYTTDELLNEYTSALALAMVKEGDISLEESLSRFSAYIGIDVENEYNAYSEKVCTELERLIALDELDEGSAYDIYGKNLLLARINTADSDSELRKIIEENAVKAEISLDRYNKLANDYVKNQVFAKMLGKTHLSFDSVGDAFYDALDSVENGSSGSSGGSGGGGGGSSSGGGSGISGGSFGSGSVTNTPAKEQSGIASFTDMNGHWAEDKVNTLASLGIVNGYSDGTFLPEKKVTRAEFSKMLCLTFGIEGDSFRAEFSDVAQSDWYAPYVLALSGKGIVNGFGGGFAPDDEITRQDAAVMTWRALQQSGVAKGSSVSFADEGYVADYAKEAVSILGGLGIINGYNNNFNPINNTTRAETASILNNVLAIIK